jgi:hypothetical protein
MIDAGSGSRILRLAAGFCCFFGDQNSQESVSILSFSKRLLNGREAAV